ncbi:uncharacterized protein LOC114932042 [Nylanderia fulva]|uniref:uncharacterized protein LOC114932042 n=1 Tax=Nylanderia fulva TaxID=613905 RepID=UPI0010FB23E4|nr:uncharacterized protein LOC114932042 [Nylanderia fulva]
MYIGDAVQWKCFLMSNIVCVVDLIRLILLNYICESVSAKAQKTENIIHKLTNLIRFDKAREEISQFVLQISLQPLKFSGMGLFNFGHKFLYKFFAWMISVIILVIQMGTSSLYQVMSRENVTCQIKILE